MVRLVFSLFTILVWGIFYYRYCRAVLDPISGVVPSLGFWSTIAFVDLIGLISLLCTGSFGLEITQMVVWLTGACCSLRCAMRMRSNFSFNAYERTCFVIVLVGVAVWKLTSIAQISVIAFVLSMVVASVPLNLNALKGKESARIAWLTVAGSLMSLGTVSLWGWVQWQKWLTPTAGLTLNVVCVLCCTIGEMRPRQVSTCAE